MSVERRYKKLPLPKIASPITYRRFHLSFNAESPQKSGNGKNNTSSFSVATERTPTVCRPSSPDAPEPIWLHWLHFPSPHFLLRTLSLSHPVFHRSALIVACVPSSHSPTATLQSTNTQTQSSSSSSGDGSLFRQRGSQAAQPDETGRVPPYVDFSQFYSLWGSDHSDGQSAQAGLGPQ